MLPDSSAAGVNDTRLGNIFCHFEANLDKAMQINADALIPSTVCITYVQGNLGSILLILARITGAANLAFVRR